MLIILFLVLFLLLLLSIQDSCRHVMNAFGLLFRWCGDLYLRFLRMFLADNLVAELHINGLILVPSCLFQAIDVELFEAVELLVGVCRDLVYPPFAVSQPQAGSRGR